MKFPTYLKPVSIKSIIFSEWMGFFVSYRGGDDVLGAEFQMKRFYSVLDSIINIDAWDGSVTKGVREIT